jgi:hypothetical protein
VVRVVEVPYTFIVQFRAKPGPVKTNHRSFQADLGTSFFLDVTPNWLNSLASPRIILTRNRNQKFR